MIHVVNSQANKTPDATTTIEINSNFTRQPACLQTLKMGLIGFELPLLVN